MLNANEFFEIVGELYHDRYRRLRPGKSESPHSGHNSSDEDNVKQFKEWVNGPLAFNDAIEKIAKVQDKVRDLEAHAEHVEEKLRETELRLRMYGGHTANCAYHQGHYKGPVSQCDCMWADLVPTVFAAQRGTEP